MSSGKSSSLGSKTRSFIPMTPRSLKSNNEQHNIRTKPATGHNESDHTGDGQPPYKKFRSSAAPKGTKLAAGYVDRAQQRLKEQNDNSGEDKEKRLQALEEMLKLQQIDQAMFESLRDEIGIGGSLESTHLVKGLDFKLLERARRGEDVSKAAFTAEEEKEIPQVDVEAELDKELERETGLQKESTKSKDTSNTEREENAVSEARPLLSRDEYLRRLKANRERTKLLALDPDSFSRDDEPQSNLDHSRFRKLESTSKPNKRKFAETVNGRRREVLVITDKEGKTKRKTRWLDPEPDPSTSAKSNDPNNVAWGGDLPAEVLAQQKAAAEKAAQQDEDEEGEDNIFGGIKEYDPLAEIDSDEERHKDVQAGAESKADDHVKSADSARTGLKSTSKTRNYFTTVTMEESDTAVSKDVAHDPAILAALKRAAQIRRQEEAGTEADDTGDGEADEDADPKQSLSKDDELRNRALLKKLQQQSHQDDLDIDMGFGGDTKHDEDDEEGEEGGRRQKLSEWMGADGYGDDDDGEGEDDKKGGGGKRKRGGKKKKGDKNSLADVMSVLERRKAK